MSELATTRKVVLAALVPPFATRFALSGSDAPVLSGSLALLMMD